MSILLDDSRVGIFAILLGMLGVVTLIVWMARILGVDVNTAAWFFTGLLIVGGLVSAGFVGLRYLGYTVSWISAIGFLLAGIWLCCWIPMEFWATATVRAIAGNHWETSTVRQMTEPFLYSWELRWGVLLGFIATGAWSLWTDIHE